MIKLEDLTAKVIRPTLLLLAEGYNGKMASEAAENLLIMTALQESEVGDETALTQLGNGPARGIWQMEVATHDSQWENFILKRDDLTHLMRGLAGKRHEMAIYPDAEEMCGNLYYACAMARIKYWRMPAPMPEHDDTLGMFEYWNKFYNVNSSNDAAEQRKWQQYANDLLR